MTEKIDSIEDTILAVLAIFEKKGQRIVNITAVSKSLEEIQKHCDLGLFFTEQLHYCPKLSKALRHMSYYRFINYYPSLKYDNFLKGRYAALRTKGRGKALRILRTADEQFRTYLENSVAVVQKEREQRDKLYPSPPHRECPIVSLS